MAKKSHIYLSGPETKCRLNISLYVAHNGHRRAFEAGDGHSEALSVRPSVIGLLGAAATAGTCYICRQRDRRRDSREGEC